MSAPDSHLSSVWAKWTGLRVVRGEGCRVVTDDGEAYLDFTGGLGAASTGYAHPDVAAAIADQASKFIHAHANVYTHHLHEPLAARLAELTPGQIDRFFFCNSGDEAVESAVKLAKHATGRPNIVVLDGAFHGRTHFTTAMSTARSIDRAGYGPFPGSVYVAPFPDPHASDVQAETHRALRGFDRILSTQVDPFEIAAIVVEPVIGERGYIPTPKGFAQGLAERCEQYGMLFVADEIQSGFGRTGDMFAFSALEVEPDIMCMAKGLSSGLPFAAIGARHELDEQWRTGSHSGSSNGNPICCAAAMATLDIITADGFLSDVADRGRRLIDGLLELQQLDPALRHVRGRGLMVATEFDTAERATGIVQHCRTESRVLLTQAGTRHRTLRWSPPLIVSNDEVDEALNAFKSAIRATAKG